MKRMLVQIVDAVLKRKKMLSTEMSVGDDPFLQ